MRREVAFFINSPENKESAFDRVLEFADSKEVGSEMADRIPTE